MDFRQNKMVEEYLDESLDSESNDHDAEVPLEEDMSDIQILEDELTQNEDGNSNSIDIDLDISKKSSGCEEIIDLYQDPLLLCSDSDFKTMFRMTHASFQNVVKFLSQDEKLMEPIENVPLYRKVLIVLWLMGHSGSYSEAGEVFGVSEEVAANCFFDVCSTLYNSGDSAISWPTSMETHQTALRIENKYGFPGVVGVLGCHYFTIPIPKDSYYRREHFNGKLRTYCVATQIVCDDRLIIMDIFPGMPGSYPEQQVLRDSPLSEQLAKKLVDNRKHILARKEYPQLSSMLTPYTTASGMLSQDELEFNRLHESVCQLVDDTFQMLLDRFRTLKMLDSEVASMVIVAACVLHNICVEGGDRFESDE